MRITVTDVVSPSYFVATAAVELGFFQREGIDAEFVFPPRDVERALRDGEIDLYGASPYVGLMGFPEWRDGKLLCALSRGAYWTLCVRADLGVARGELSAVRGLRILAGGGPAMALRQLLMDAGVDPVHEAVQIVPSPWPPDPSGNQARQGARAIEEGVADGFWGNAMRAAYAERRGLATVLLDVRRDGPPAARRYTFPALVTTTAFMERHPQDAASAVRAIVRTQRALADDPSLATKAAQRIFPAAETALIAELMARDVPYFDAAISEEAFAGASEFAQRIGLLHRPVRYEDVVATDLRPLWTA